MRRHSHISRPTFLALLVALCALGASGCGGSEQIVSVSGTVTHNGQPVPGLVVSFVPDAATETGVSTGETDRDGKYSLKVAKSGSSGAVVGKHKVWVSLPRQATAPTAGDQDDKPNKPKATPTAANVPAELAPVLNKYGSLEKSPLAVEVKGGEPIDLKLD
jgi:hypothetical protein